MVHKHLITLWIKNIPAFLAIPSGIAVGREISSVNTCTKIQCLNKYKSIGYEAAEVEDREKKKCKAYRKGEPGGA